VKRKELEAHEAAVLALNEQTAFMGYDNSNYGYGMEMDGSNMYVDGTY